jgi:hypothetical protein
MTSQKDSPQTPARVEGLGDSNNCSQPNTKFFDYESKEELSRVIRNMEDHEDLLVKEVEGWIALINRAYREVPGFRRWMELQPLPESAIPY